MKKKELFSWMNAIRVMCVFVGPFLGGLCVSDGDYIIGLCMFLIGVFMFTELARGE